MLRNRLSVSGGVLNPANVNQNSLHTASKQSVSANMLNSSPGNASVMQMGGPSFSTFLSGFVPDQNEAALTPHYREIYYYDSVGGATVDLLSTFPFSDFTLVGLESKELFAFSESMSRMNMRLLFQEISNAYLVDSSFIGTLLFDSKAKAFQDVLIHDFRSASFSSQPFHALDPVITVDSSYQLQNFLNTASPYTQGLLGSYPQALLDKYASGPVVLDPLTTLFLPRKSLREKVSTSYLKRLLPVYLLEKTLYRGTLMETARRQRSTTHIMAGDENWVPTDAEMGAILGEFQRTDLDPLGAWIITRNGLQVQDVRIAGDFYKWTDTFDTLTPFKLRALGISEAFLSGDASFATAEAAISVFLENAEAYRQVMTYRMFTSKIFPILAVLHGLYRDSSKVSDNSTNEGLMKNISNQRNLKIPTVRWHKSLEGRDQASQWDMLEKLSEKGFNVPMKMLAAAAGVDITSLLTEMEEDIEVRKSLNAMNQRIENEAPSTKEDHSNQQPGGNEDRMEFSALPHTASSNVRRKVPLLSREFDQSKPIGILSKSGKVLHAVTNESSHHRRINDKIVKAMQTLSDPHHRKQVRDKVAAQGLNTDFGII